MDKIMKLDEYENAIFYRAACSCTDSRCDLSLELEMDEEINMIFLNIYEDLYYASYWETDNWFIDKWYRIKGALQLLFTGRIKIGDTFIFRGVDQINDFLIALEKGIEQLKINAEKGKAIPSDKNEFPLEETIEKNTDKGKVNEKD